MDPANPATTPAPEAVRGASDIGGDERDGITLTALSKRYGDSTVVDAIDLSVRQGEFMTFLGPSGSGKTTTLNMIAGFVPVSSGTIAIHGRPVSEVPPHKRDIGMVFQSYALFPHKTVGQNVAYPLDRRRIKGRAKRQLVADTLEMVQLSEFENRYPAELSGGQQQRAALARALVYSPRVLLMDEPLGALDRKLREWLQSEIKRIHREVGSTFVYVTHDQEEALSMSDRIAIFNNGRIEQVGTARDLYEAPRTLFVGRFIGESTVFRGPAEADGSDVTVVEAAGIRLRVPGRAPRGTAAILVRPERLTLEADLGAEGGSDNVVPVRVKDVTYLGSVTRYVVALPDDSEGVVRLDSDAPTFDVGQSLSMRWPVVSGVLLEAEGDTGFVPDSDETGAV